eukprot:4601174-Alexandrium_andersonii.AAC.1
MTYARPLRHLATPRPGQGHPDSPRSEMFVALTGVACAIRAIRSGRITQMLAFTAWGGGESHLSQLPRGRRRHKNRLWLRWSRSRGAAHEPPAAGAQGPPRRTRHAGARPDLEIQLRRTCGAPVLEEGTPRESARGLGGRERRARGLSGLAIASTAARREASRATSSAPPKASRLKVLRGRLHTASPTASCVALAASCPPSPPRTRSWRRLARREGRSATPRWERRARARAKSNAARPRHAGGGSAPPST